MRLIQAIYIYIYTRGCNPPSTSYFLRPNSSKSWYQSDWIFVDDLGRIERDRVWGSGKAYHARAYAILLSRTPINERNREPPLLERVIQIDDQFFFPPVSFSFFSLFFITLPCTLFARQIPSRALGNVFFQRLWSPCLSCTRWSILICRWIRVESIRETRWMQVRV